MPGSIKAAYMARKNIWDAIRSLKRGFTRQDVATLSGEKERTVNRQMELLVRAGFLSVARTGRKGCRNGDRFSLAKDNGTHAPDVDGAGNPRKLTANQRMWAAIKVLKKFRHVDLALATGQKVTTARSFSIKLKRVGYLKVLQPGRPGCPEVLALNPLVQTGPLCPIFLGGSIYDPNADALVQSRKECA